VRDRQLKKKREVVKRQKPRGFPITPSQLRHADAHALARLLRFLRLPEPTASFEKLAELLNDGVTVWKRAHVAVNKKVW